MTESAIVVDDPLDIERQRRKPLDLVDDQRAILDPRAQKRELGETVGSERAAYPLVVERHEALSVGEKRADQSRLADLTGSDDIHYSSGCECLVQLVG